MCACYALYSQHVITTTGATILPTTPIGSGEIWLDNVACSGDETGLIDCRANPLGDNNCVHDEDAGVRCRPGRYLQL
jgi:hypothetical protein